MYSTAYFNQIALIHIIHNNDLYVNVSFFPFWLNCVVNKPSFLCFTLFVLVCYIVSLLAINSRFHRWYLFRIVISCCMHCIYHLYITWVYKLLNIVTYFVSCNTCIINWLYAQHMLRVNLKTYVSFRESNKKKNLKNTPFVSINIVHLNYMHLQIWFSKINTLCSLDVCNYLPVLLLWNKIIQLLHFMIALILSVILSIMSTLASVTSLYIHVVRMYYVYVTLQWKPNKTCEIIVKR